MHKPTTGTAEAAPTVDVTLSIVNTNNRALLRACLQTIRTTVRRVSYDVIVVDNASEDGSVEMVREEFPEARVVVNERRRGYGDSHNRAIALAAGRYVLVLNEDMEMLEGAIDSMVATADGIPDLGALGCRILNPDLTLQHSCFRFPTLKQEFFEALFPYTLAFPRSPLRSKMYEWAHDTMRDVDIVVGCCMLVPREAIRRVGAFDPAFFVYSEEHDWCRRLRDAGLRVVFTPAAEMIHFGGQTSKRMSLRMALIQLDSRTRFFLKHRGALRAGLFRVVVAFGSLIRAAGWAAILVARRRPETGAREKLDEYLASLKFIATWKPRT